MHPNHATLERFYNAFAHLDAGTMASCYAPDAQFDADAKTGKAHWEADDRFSATGRLVHNVIDGVFEFNAQGLIARHRDSFNFWSWSRQALGTPGLLLGWTPFLRQKVRATAAASLQKYLTSRNP